MLSVWNLHRLFISILNSEPMWFVKIQCPACSDSFPDHQHFRCFLSWSVIYLLKWTHPNLWVTKLVLEGTRYFHENPRGVFMDVGWKWVAGKGTVFSQRLVFKHRIIRIWMLLKSHSCEKELDLDKWSSSSARPIRNCKSSWEIWPENQGWVFFFSSSEFVRYLEGHNIYFLLLWVSGQALEKSIWQWVCLYSLHFFPKYARLISKPWKRRALFKLIWKTRY